MTETPNVPHALIDEMDNLEKALLSGSGPKVRDNYTRWTQKYFDVPYPPAEAAYIGERLARIRDRRRLL